MERYLGIERRDPAAGVLRLGSALASAYEEARTGRITVTQGAFAGEFSLQEGLVTRIEVGRAPISPAGWTGTRGPGAVERLFGLERPRVLWRDDLPHRGQHGEMDPRWAVVVGVSARAEAFDPQRLVERIPVDVLKLRETELEHIKALPFLAEEREFFARLLKPTPVTMLLWKRGMEPRRAGALIVALNLLGAFRGSWEPGDLPRMSTALRVMGMVSRGCPDHLLLGLDPWARQPELDRAFRRLSRELHPDRAETLPREEAELARRAFLVVNDAYLRLRGGGSRRRRPVSSPPREAGVEELGDDWRVLARSACLAHEAGERDRARAYALKALVRMPPGHSRRVLVQILSQAA